MVKSNASLLLSFCLAAAACDLPTRESTEPEAELGVIDAAPALVNFWSIKRSIPALRNLAVAGAENNIIYFVGGRDNGGQSTKTVLAYTIATDSWCFKADLPKNRRSPNGATFLGGRLYVSGGISNTGGAAKTLYAYNPATNTWSQKASMPDEGACGAQAAIAGRLYVYLPGGGSCGSVHRFSRYNPNNNNWTSLPTPPSVHGSPVGGAIDGKFYLAGGTLNGALARIWPSTSTTRRPTAGPPRPRCPRSSRTRPGRRCRASCTWLVASTSRP